MLRRKTQFQHVPVILLSGKEAVGSMLLCASSCVMNHVLNVHSVLSQPCYYPSVGFLLLSSESSESSYVVPNVWIMWGAGCVVATLCSTWMLHLLRPGCSGVIAFPEMSAENLSACLIIRRLMAEFPNYWIRFLFFPFPRGQLCSVINFSTLFWRADGVLMNFTGDILMWTSHNLDVNCQAGALGRSYYLVERLGIVCTLLYMTYIQFGNWFNVII